MRPEADSKKDFYFVPYPFNIQQYSIYILLFSNSHKWLVFDLGILCHRVMFFVDIVCSSVFKYIF